MPRRRVWGFAGIALGAGVGLAVAAGPAAVADPVADAIADAWPYGVPLGSPPYLPGYGAALPGFPHIPSSTTNFQQQNFGPLTWTQSDFNSLLGPGQHLHHSITA